MHSHRSGEKLNNIRVNPKVGFEVDQYICFLPSYYFHPHDASQADTLYISIVIKGEAEIINDCEEKTVALNMLMQKYQNRDRYQELNPSMPSVREVAVVKISPHEIHGKYKIGQQWAPAYRLKIAKAIVNREEKYEAKKILDVMRIERLSDGNLKIIEEPLM
jgi:nitroimidazol reductase NimA-like FMN-containing flavoprotein (pyridoxamine 5'-phosphate oxidase superfamily)